MSAIAEQTDRSNCRENLWNVVCRSPAIFGRLWSVSRLKNGNTGRYQHALADKFGVAVVDAELRQMHREVFSTWLGLKLQQQERDLSVWLRWSDREPEFLNEVERLLPTVIPDKHLGPEKPLFLSDFRIVRVLLSQPEPLQESQDVRKGSRTSGGFFAGLKAKLTGK